MAFLFGAFLGLVMGVAMVMAFARLENTRAEQRRELVRVDVPILSLVLRFLVASTSLIQFDLVVFRRVIGFLDLRRLLREELYI